MYRSPMGATDVLPVQMRGFVCQKETQRRRNSVIFLPLALLALGLWVASSSLLVNETRQRRSRRAWLVGLTAVAVRP